MIKTITTLKKKKNISNLCKAEEVTSRTSTEPAHETYHVKDSHYEY